VDGVEGSEEDGGAAQSVFMLGLVLACTASLCSESEEVGDAVLGGVEQVEHVGLVDRLAPLRCRLLAQTRDEVVCPLVVLLGRQLLVRWELQQARHEVL